MHQVLTSMSIPKKKVIEKKNWCNKKMFLFTDATLAWYVCIDCIQPLVISSGKEYPNGHIYNSCFIFIILHIDKNTY